MNLHQTRQEYGNSSVWDIVKVLLYEHDCVIVPGFGGFVCNHEPARIDQVSNMILPPGKRIVFNQNLRTNDGLLAGKFAQLAGISYQDAMSRIESGIKSFLDSLNEKKQFSLDKFGSFRLNAEANFVFIPDRQNNYLTTSYGLMPLQSIPARSFVNKLAPPLIAPERKLKVKPVKDLKPALKERRKSRVRPLVTITTLLVMLCSGGWLFLNLQRPLSDENKQQMEISGWFDSLLNLKLESLQQTSALNTMPDTTSLIPSPSTSPNELIGIPSSPLEKMHDSLPVETPEKQVETKPVNELEAFANHIGEARKNWFIPSTISETPVLENKVIPATEINSVDPGKEQPIISIPKHVASVIHSNLDTLFYVIGGVFCRHRNAEHFFHAMQEKGFQTEMLINPGNNCSRVSLGTFSSEQKAETFLTEIKSSGYPDAWLLRGAN